MQSPGLPALIPLGRTLYKNFELFSLFRRSLAYPLLQGGPGRRRCRGYPRRRRRLIGRIEEGESEGVNSEWAYLLHTSFLPPSPSLVINTSACICNSLLPPDRRPSLARFCLFVLFSSLAFVPLKNRKKKEMTSFSNGCCIRPCPTPSSFSRFRVGASWSGRSRLWRVCTSCLTRQTGMSEVSSLARLLGRAKHPPIFSRSSTRSPWPTKLKERGEQPTKGRALDLPLL